ncbi:MAG: HAMP domain-containing protein [Clostridiales bacterium]|nr:HAMP domain-containing protein [Clostridiales bacterium]
MRKSFRFKITFILTLLFIITIFLTWFINHTFLPNYYLYSKQKTLDMAYQKVQGIYLELDESEFLLSDERMLELERLATNNNIDLYVYRIDYKLYGINGIGLLESYPNREDFGYREYLQVLGAIQGYLFRGTNPDLKYKNELYTSEVYSIYSSYDRQKDSNYIDLIGNLNENYIIFIRTNFESIQESVAIANKFLAFIGIIAVIIGTTAILIISNKFTQPILQLADIAKKMSNLDFDVKYPVKSQDEIGVLGSSINILSEKLEETITELKQSNNDLLNEIKKKTEIDEMRKEFLSNVSHELKTPLALIQGYAEGLKENINEDQESRDFYLDVIMDETNKMTTMVKRLLTLNELEFGSNQVQFERFDIIPVIRSVLNAADILIKQKDITLIFNHQDPIYVWADEYLVQQVVTNYISNAINHVSGANVIEIKLIPQEETIRVAVFNTGENIPEDELDKIWVKFYKVDKARTREYGGNGIGLSIVKAIMNSMNRKCGVVNRTSGVEFWFELDMKV